ncbi:MAG: mechanosensitive ion channel protein, partial [Thiotrichales bacterium]|nr:mechanosensitive ion channel protein [Thiotrichales bacterium]
MQMESLGAQLSAWLQATQNWLGRPEVYVQAGVVALITVLAMALAARAGKMLETRLQSLNQNVSWFAAPLTVIRQLLLPMFLLGLLWLTHSLFMQLNYSHELLKFAFSLVLVVSLFVAVNRYVNHLFLGVMLKWVMIPTALLYMLGILDQTVSLLEALSIEIGEVHVSVYMVLRLLVFGAVLFWLGRLSNQYGQQLIRSKQSLDARSREVFAKLFEIALFVVIFLLLLNAVGINLTALAV